MYCNKFKLIFLLLVVFMASACKKDSLTNEFGDDNLAINIPGNPLDQAPKPPIDTTKFIVVLGSSTAAGFGASVADSCWVGRLYGKLLADKKAIKVVNLGKGGYTTYQLMYTDAPVVPRRPVVDTNKNVTAALKFKPSLVIINLPTNDVAANYRDEEIINNYRLIINVLELNNVQYIITGSQPRNFKTLDQRKRLKILNDKLIAAFPGHIDDYLRKISTATWAIQKNYAAGDGIHLNNNGHKVIFQSLIDFPIFKRVAGY